MLSSTMKSHCAQSLSLQLLTNMTLHSGVLELGQVTCAVAANLQVETFMSKDLGDASLDDDSHTSSGGLQVSLSSTQRLIALR